jgi:hypothetical protein
MTRRTTKGATLVETLVVTLMSTIVIFASLACFLQGAGSWAKGQSNMTVQDQSRRTVRIIADELREAMSVFVDADGMGLTYRKPRLDAEGNFETPVIWDGVTRRIYFDEGKLFMGPDGQERIICTDVIVTDPKIAGNPPYRTFVPGGGSITRSLDVKVITSTPSGVDANKVISRKRETIFLRNVPELIL